MNRYRLHRAFPCALLLVAGCTLVRAPTEEFGGWETPRILTPEQVADRVIDARDIRRYVGFLASDQMRGRDTPSPELERAAAWIGDRFQRLGLEPAGDDGGFIQFWPYERQELAPGQAVVAWSGAGRGSLDYGRDFAALTGPGGGEGRLVYLGRAEDAPAAMDAAAGRVAVVLLSGSRPQDWRWPITVRRSALTAARAGALGVIFLLDPAFDGDAVARVAAGFESPTAESQPLPLFFVLQAAARPLLRAAGGDLDALIAATNSGDRTPVPLDRASVGVRAAARRTEVRVPNVVARLPGTDSARVEEYVILVAHFDHLGVGPPDETGDSIYSGADDNASGTAALLEVAEAFVRMRARAPRPVLFLAVSGEEKGLLGSTWFARNPSVFMSDAVAVLNMDMVGRNHPDSVAVIGYAYSSLGPFIHRVARETPALGLHVAPDPMPQENLFQRSDHYPFAQGGIPAVAVTTLLHDDYHLPSDRPDRIDAEKAARVARLVFLVAYELAHDGYRPQWTEEGRRAVRGR